MVLPIEMVRHHVILRKTNLNQMSVAIHPTAEAKGTQSVKATYVTIQVGSIPQFYVANIWVQYKGIYVP